MDGPDLHLTAELGTWHRDYRLEGLKAAVALSGPLEHEHGQRRDCGCDELEPVLHAAGVFAAWLSERAVRIRVGNPTITEQGHPARHLPLHRGADMAVTMTDGQIATYPAPEAVDSKGFPVADTITITTDDSAGAIVTQVSNDDGSVAFTGVGPGAVQVTWSDGTLVFADSINVTTGAAASLVVGAPVVTDQPTA